MVDPERRDGDPRALLVGVEGQHVWDQPTERFRRHRVMQKKQVVPALRHDPRRHGRGPGAMRGGKQNGIGAHPLRPALFLSGAAIGGGWGGVCRHGLAVNHRAIRIFLRFPHVPGCPRIPYRISFTAMSSSSKPNDSTEAPARHGPSTDVYAVHGADPEVLAYGMAKYSRSALSMRESLAELNEQKAEKFLNTFYFQYGH